MRRQARPFHVRVGDGMFQPGRHGRLGHGPPRLAGGRVELQALAGCADQFGTVAVSQRPGKERLGLIAPGHPPADLKRAALVLPAADCGCGHRTRSWRPLNAESEQFSDHEQAGYPGMREAVLPGQCWRSADTALPPRPCPVRRHRLPVRPCPARPPSQPERCIQRPSLGAARVGSVDATGDAC